MTENKAPDFLYEEESYKLRTCLANTRQNLDPVD